MCPWIFNVYMNSVKEGKNKNKAEGRDCLASCISEEDLRAMVEHFVDVCRRRCLKVNAVKSKVMLQNGEEGMECEVHVNRM